MVKRRCPNARWVMDPFHVVQWMNDALDAVRCEEWNAARAAAMLPPMYFPPFTPMIHNRSRQPAPAGYANVFPPLSAPPPNLSR
ncbi:transposase, partial [Adlercreutzia equolifaciens]|uniref:transposase n=1 Tax=Adlercreutzia equolifaciens TaxID=446660 RepID=UPI002351A52F